MKYKLRTAGSLGVLLAAFAGGMNQADAQETVQTLAFHLTAYSPTSGGSVRTVHIATKDVITFLAGTNVPNGHLFLVTPDSNAPGTLGNLNAFLRITSGSTVVAEVPSPDSFNLFQDSASVIDHGKRISVRAINRFSIDFGGFHAELQGLASWSVGETGSGSFTVSVNGVGTADGLTESSVPMRGTISAGAPKTL